MEVYSLLDVSCDPLWFPVDNGKTLRADEVSCGVAMVVDGGWGPEIFFKFVPKVWPDCPMHSPGQFMCGHLNL